MSIDTLRADHVGAIGYGRGTTPEIDRLAAKGAVFTQAIAQSSWTRASVASYLTGLYPTTLGLTCHSFRLPKKSCDVLPESVVTLAEALESAGLRTAAVLANINVDPAFGFGQGFQSVSVVTPTRDPSNPEWRFSDEIFMDTTIPATEAALAWLDDRAADRDRFFLYLHYLDPHDPYTPPEPHRSNFRPEEYPDVDPRSRESIAAYDGEIEFVDAELGRIFRRLEESGLAESTGVVILSDHGEEFREHGGTSHGYTMYDELIRVPLIMALPGWTKAASRFDGQARLLDLMPTLLEVLSARPPGGLQGRSMVPDLEGRPGPPLPALSEWGYTPLISWRDPPWKLIYDPEKNAGMLFNLDEDPGELHDLLVENGGRAEAMRESLLDARDRAKQEGKRLEREDGAVPLTDEQIDRLRSLGYVD